MWDMQAVELPVWPDEKPASVTATGFTPQNELLAIGLGANGNLSCGIFQMERRWLILVLLKGLTVPPFRKKQRWLP